MNERQKGFGQLVVACSDAPEVFDASEESFDQIAVAVEMVIEVALSQAIGTGRDDGLRTSCPDHGNEVVGIVALVRNDSACRQVFDGLGGIIDIGNLARREDHPQRIAQGVDGDVQLGGQPAPRAADRLATGFFLAPAEC